MTVKVGRGLRRADSGKNLDVAWQAFSCQLSAFLASRFGCQDSATMVFPGRERTWAGSPSGDPRLIRLAQRKARQP